jgi:uncharacterized membrane protein (UPF0127 family)
VAKRNGGVGCERCTFATTPLARMRGLLGRAGLASEEGMLLRPAGSVHTAFMRFPIDVVFLDRDLTVTRVVPELPPFRAVRGRGARSTLELRAGEAERRGLAPGDELEVV